MFRRYNRWWSRFDQPDPYDASYDLTNPQSFNRYAYVQNDPVNLSDPTGLFTNCGQGDLPPCEEEPPPRDPTEDLPRRADDKPIRLPIVVQQKRGSTAGTLKPRAEKQIDPQEDKCNKLRAAILAKAGKLLDELRKYDPVTDGQGGINWQPGGQYTEISELQHGIKMDLKNYLEECLKNKGGPSGPSVPDWVDDAANRRVEVPLYRPFYRPVQEAKPWWKAVVPAGGAALVIYLIISEGSRLFPPRNLVPVP